MPFFISVFKIDCLIFPKFVSPIQLMPAHSNRLINETSPYLLQHAHNPVDWYPWGEEALAKAKKDNKPILVSIGYAACHWCHVMERESFENEETAAIMNEHFVNIKIDREERPDLDHIYMDAVQAMTGSGGWPLNVFLTPDAKPFFGGTYFPPQRAYNRSSWTEVLHAVSNAFERKRQEVDSQAETLIAHIVQSNSLASVSPIKASSTFAMEKVHEVYQSLMNAADKTWGGYGEPPKFPQTFSIQFLLRYYFITKQEPALKQALLSLDKMIEGGIYDQIGGGFARYSTDREWLVPHFEKMLYDNALLVSVISEAYQLTRNERYKEVLEETIAFIRRELMLREGGFFSALDADSEGEEGKYYVWTYEQVKTLLNNDAEVFTEFFDISEVGNWSEGTLSGQSKNILRTKTQLETFATEKNIPVEKLRNIIQKGKSILLSERNKRTRPALDDKIILGWNALMNTACSKAFAATGKNEYRDLALVNMKFLLQYFQNANEKFLYHTWKNNEPKNFAFLDDYAFLIQALMHLQEITGDVHWLFKARELTEYVMENFTDDITGFFFFTDRRQNDVILRKKEIYDGATPSGNATMAYNAYQMSIILNFPDWRKIPENMITSLARLTTQYPTSFGVWATLLTEMICGTEEITVIGENNLSLGEQVLAEYIPHKVFMAPSKPHVELPLLVGKTPTNPPLIYLCRSYSCLNPVARVSQLLELLRKVNKN
jgi:uncharacterized protein YyaL (SSP411 family)